MPDLPIVPKAVLHTCGNHYYNALGSNANLPLTAEDRWLLDLPLHHVAGLGIVFRCLLAGAAVVMPDRGESLDAALDRYGVTHLSVVVEIERALADHDGVEQAVVVPVPDEEFGERCVAFVRPRGSHPDTTALAAWLRRSLPSYKVPDRFHAWPDTARDTFKIDRARFRRLALEAQAGTRPDRRDA